MTEKKPSKTFFIDPKAINHEVFLTKRFLIASIILLTLLFGAYYLLKPQSFEYEYVEDNVKFKSNDNPPLNYLNQLSRAQTLLVLGEVDGNLDVSGMSRTAVVFTSVGVANGKQVITVMKQYNASNEFESCYTNQGTGKTVSFESDYCQTLIDSIISDGATVLHLPFEDDSLQQSQVIIEPGRITFKVASYESVVGKSSEIERVSFLVAKHMYPNAEEVMRKVNEFGSRFNNVQTR